MTGTGFPPPPILAGATPARHPQCFSTTGVIARTQIPNDTAPGSGVPIDRAASGRARPTLGDIAAVASAPASAAATAFAHAYASRDRG